ncbi:MAG: diguanylate cyclase [Magnetococcus sp. WYHC-3]
MTLTLENYRDYADAHLHPIQVAPRIWWVGHYLEGDPFQCHVYLLENGTDSVLFDPGSRLTIRHSLDKIQRILPLAHIRYFVCHHQDPDITSSLPELDDLVRRDDAVVVTHWRAEALLKHYGLRMKFWRVEDHDWRLSLGDRDLRFIFTPYAHFPGAFVTYDEKSRVLFTSDIFGGFTDGFSLVAQDAGYFEDLRPFHEHYIPSRDVLQFTLRKLEVLDIAFIAPQHGSLIPAHLVPPILEKMKSLDCGLYLLAKDDTDIQRLMRLNHAVRAISRTMMESGSFPDMVDVVLQNTRRVLPARALEFFVRVEGGKILHMSEETRYRGRLAEVPGHIQPLLELSRGTWAENTGGRFLMYFPDDRGTVVVVPLFLPDTDRIQALLLFYMDVCPVGGAVDDMEFGNLLGEMLEPVRVAVEREAVNRMLDLERQQFYERSIRDPLTGLFTRVYMNEMVHRLLNIHDRDGKSTVAVIMLDIDHFKSINDTFGHNIGDVVLRRVAGELLSTLREGDLPVRLGGEEFAIFVLGESATRVQDMAERIRLKIAAMRFDSPLDQRTVTVSLGVALHLLREKLLDLLERADQALYRAKKSGRNQVQMAE